MAASERNAGELLLQLGGDVLAQGGVDLVLECTGAPPCIQMGVFMCKIRGRMVQVGMGPKDVIVPLWRVNIRVSSFFFLLAFASSSINTSLIGYLFFPFLHIRKLS